MYSRTVNNVAIDDPVNSFGPFLTLFLYFAVPFSRSWYRSRNSRLDQYIHNILDKTIAMVRYVWSSFALLAVICDVVAVVKNSTGRDRFLRRSNGEDESSGLLRQRRLDSSPLGLFRGSSTSIGVDPDKICYRHRIYYKYTFEDGCVLEGYTKGVDILLNWCKPNPNNYTAIDLHVSCSDDYVNGYSTKGHGPQMGVHPPVVKYFIQKLNPDDCTVKGDCNKSTDVPPSPVKGDRQKICASNDNNSDCDRKGDDDNA